MIHAIPAVLLALSLLFALWSARATEPVFAFWCSVAAATFLGAALTW